MTFFLAERDRYRYEQAACWSYLSEPMRDGHFRLFNRNGDRTTHVRVVAKTVDRYGWLVEHDGDVDPYFARMLQSP